MKSKKIWIMLWLDNGLARKKSSYGEKGEKNKHCSDIELLKLILC